MIQDGLVVGIGVDGRHQAVLDAKGFVQNLYHGRKAIGGAGSVGYNIVLFLVILIVVDTQHHGQVNVAGRSGNDYLAGAPLHVPCCLFAIGENARGLYHQVHTHFRPGNPRRVPLREHFDIATVNYQVPIVRLHLSLVNTVAGVVFEQVRIRLVVGKVVYCRYFQLVRVALHGSAGYQPTYPAKAVDSNPCSHSLLLQISVSMAAAGHGPSGPPTSVPVIPTE